MTEKRHSVGEKEPFLTRDDPVATSLLLYSPLQSFIMQIKALPIALVLALGIMACKNEAPPQSTTTDTVQQPDVLIPEAQPAPAPAPASGPAATTASGNVKLNPPHGQPGHRCDISVGAPLDGSAPASPTIQTSVPTSTTPININTATPPPAGSASGKVNPPHGQPGHRCDIAVGAPLN